MLSETDEDGEYQQKILQPTVSSWLYFDYTKDRCTSSVYIVGRIPLACYVWGVKHPNPLKSCSKRMNYLL